MYRWLAKSPFLFHTSKSTINASVKCFLKEMASFEPNKWTKNKEGLQSLINCLLFLLQDRIRLPDDKFASKQQQREVPAEISLTREEMNFFAPESEEDVKQEQNISRTNSALKVGSFQVKPWDQCSTSSCYIFRYRYSSHWQWAGVKPLHSKASLKMGAENNIGPTYLQYHHSLAVVGHIGSYTVNQRPDQCTVYLVAIKNWNSSLKYQYLT